VNFMDEAALSVGPSLVVRPWLRRLSIATESVAVLAKRGLSSAYSTVDEASG